MPTGIFIFTGVCMMRISWLFPTRNRCRHIHMGNIINTARMVMTIAGLCVVLQSHSTQAAPPPPRGGPSSTISSPPERMRPDEVLVNYDAIETARTAAVYKPMPLKEIAAEHKKNDGLTTRKIDAAYEQFMTNMLKRDYLEHGSRSEKWDKTMLAAIDETLKLQKIQSSNPQRHELRKMLIRIGRKKCDDPRYYYMFAYARGYILFDEVGQALATASELAQKDVAHNRHLLWLVNLRHSQFLIKLKKPQEAQAARIRARMHFVQWLEHDQPGLDPLLVYSWMDYFFEMIVPLKKVDGEEESIEQTLQAIEGISTLEPWIKVYIRARQASSQAWRARGGGWAHEVTDEGWKVWGEKNELAYALAIKAHDLNPNEAMASTLLVELCRAGDVTLGPRFDSRYWFEQAVSVVVDYKDAYHEYAWGLVPRWGGTIQAELEFARECISTERPETRSAFRACHVVRNIMLDCDKEAPLDPKLMMVLYDIIENACKQYLAVVTDPDERKQLEHYWFNWTRILSLPAQAAIVQSQMDEPFDTTLAYTKTYSLPGVTQYALNVFLARNKAHGTQYTQALHSDWFDKDWAKTSALYEALVATPDIDPVILHYAASRLQTHIWQQKLDTGQWVDLNVGANMEGFKPLTGQWERIDEKTLQGTSDSLPMRLEIMVDLGKRYEIQMTIDFIHQPEKAPALMAGMVYAWAAQPKHYLQYGVFVCQQPGSIWAHLGVYDPYRFSSLPVPKKITCLMTYDNGTATVVMDSKEVFAPYRITQNTSWLRLAIGTANQNGNGAIIQYSNLRIRKLPER